MRRLYLIRHGEAESERVSPARPLTDKGRNDTKKLAAFLKQSQAQAGIILHSDKLRAQETAQILQKLWCLKASLREEEGLNPNDDPQKILGKIERHSENLVIVGHLPLVERLLSLLMRWDESRVGVRFKEDTTVVLGKDTTSDWHIVLVVSPDSLPNSFAPLA